MQEQNKSGVKNGGFAVEVVCERPDVKEMLLVSRMYKRNNRNAVGRMGNTGMRAVT